MILDERASVWIYGYGTRGRSIAKQFELEGIKICGFLDRNPAQNRQEQNVVQICKPEEITPSADIVLVCSLTDVFAHAEIADRMSKLGFTYIVYKSFRNNPAGKAIDALYNRLTFTLGHMPFKGMVVPAYADVMASKERSYADGDGIVRTDIPVELLFGLTRSFLEDSFLWKDQELLDVVPEKSLLYYTPPQKMMQYFAGEIDEESWEQSKRLWAACRNAQSYISPLAGRFSEEEQEANLENRYRIFQKMDQLSCENPSFFRENPISVVWNERGWFHIQDGNNRAAFLLAKGLYRIPAQMTKADYAAWLSGKEAAEEVQMVLARSKAGFRAPVLCPQLADVASTLEYYSHRKTAAMCDWLWRKRLDPRALSVCEYFCSNDLCASHIARMGGSLTVIDTEEQLALHKALDRLYRLNTVCYGRGDRNSFQLILSNRETALDELAETGIRAKWYILEFVNKTDAEIEAMAAAFAFERPRYIMRQLVGSRIYKTAAFKRGSSVCCLAGKTCKPV